MPSSSAIFPPHGSGTTNGTWANSDTTSSNFSGLNFTAAKAQSTVAVFGDTTTAGGTVSNYSLTVGTGGASTGTVLFENTTAQSYTIASADSNGITGTTAITKTGNGTVTFTGSNSYTGTTTVKGGSLVINGNISTSSLTTVDSGATLGGIGTVGTTTVNGIFAPGNSIGTMNALGTLTLVGISDFEIDPTSGIGLNRASDLANVTGAVS